jgi:hypothetical protein
MKTSSFLNKKTLFASISIISIIGYSFVVFAAAPNGGYTPGGTLDPDCAPGDIDCIVTLPASQWDNVLGGINYADGNVGISDITPGSKLSIKGQNPNNFISLLGADSSINYNNFQIHLEDNSSDQFGVIDMYASPEESFILSGYKVDGSATGSFRLSTQGITTINSSDNVSNLNNIEINPTATSFNNTNSFENFLFQLYPNVARFVPSTNTRSGVSIGNMGMISADEAGLYDAGGDVPLAVFDATNNRAYYTPQMFVDYNTSVVSVGDPHGSLGGILVNYADGAINIGRAETNAADGIEGIQVYQNGNNPIVRLGSSAFTGNGTNITIDDFNQTVGFNFSGGSYIFPTADGSAGQVLTTDGSGNLTWAPGGGSGWSLTGNAGTTAGTNFIGTTDAQDFVVKTNGNEIGRFYSTVGPSSYSVALGGGVAPSVNMFVYGPSAGIGATSAQNSNFLGIDAGNGAINANDSNFFGQSAGEAATDAYHSNFFGWAAGANATNASNSNFFGQNAGSVATNASNSNFFGNQAGSNATDAYESNFFGSNAGIDAINARNSNFFGRIAGGSAANAYQSNFFGNQSGFGALNAHNSNFLGALAGYESYNANNSNFIGRNAGRNADNAKEANFIGDGAGYGAFNANNSIFIGKFTGHQASYSSHSIFLGDGAGSWSDTIYGSTKASNSIFIGQGSGAQSFDLTLDNTTNPDDFSILLGNNTSTGGFENSIALGQRATNTSSNQFMIGSTTRPIDETKIIGSLGTECTITTGTGMACTSDERLKTNITDLTSDTLSKLQNVRTVSYNWLQNPDSPLQIGFLAQNLEQYFPEMVMTDATGKKQVYYSQMTPILTKAIQEMNLKITDIGNTETPNTWRDSLIAWFGNVENGITKLFVTEVDTKNLCVSDDVGGKTCITKAQLDQLLSNAGSGGSGSNPVVITPDPTSDPDPDVTANTGGDSSSDQLQDNTDASGDSGDSSGDIGSSETPTE